MVRSGKIRFVGGFALLLSVPTVLHAQRSEENATQSAEDAYGTSIGNESIGLYGSTEVRGFSPVAAGNVRIDGLYFDQQGSLNWRLHRESNVRVGLTAQGYPFPAPTGIVDFGLRVPGEERLASAVLGYGPHGGNFAEIDTLLPLSRQFGIGGGISLYNDEYPDGGSARYEEAALLSRWQTEDGRFEVVPFWSRARWSNMLESPVISVAGSYLPPEFERDRFFGQRWAEVSAIEDNFGVLGSLDLPRQWRLRFGLFRSRSISKHGHAGVLVDVRPDGGGESIMFADPRQTRESWSGEVRLTKLLIADAFKHSIDLAVRARDKEAVYGGSDVAALGEARVGVYSPVPEPTFQFAQTASDRVKQPAIGVTYSGQWLGIGEFSAGMQRVNYTKVTHLESGARDTLEDRVWLYNATLAVHAAPQVALFASYTRGLEESGVAPDSAFNRNALLPATITRQWDAGVRWTIGTGLRWVVSWFDVQKPYASVDASNVYRFLGDEVHRGIETSFTGKLGQDLTVVVGAMFADPKVSNVPELSGAGSRPVGQARRKINASVDYALDVCDCSLDLNVSHVGTVTASLEGDLSVPAFTSVDIGGRYRFAIAERPILVRVQVTNLTDEYGWEVVSHRSFLYTAGRTVSAYVAADF